jgi:aquaporin Z
MNNLLKKAIAECIGTFVLVFVACGVAAFTGGDLVATSLAFGLVIVAMAYSIGRISGCHINPAVSLGCLLTKRMSVVEFLVYVLAQVVGGFLGAVALFGFAKLGGAALLGNACNYQVGWNGTDLTTGGIIAALLVEIVLTFIFVYVILNVTAENSGAGKKAGIIIGLTLTLVHLIGINFTGTSVNPARSIATAFGDLIFNGKAEALGQVWIFIVAPLAGAALAALIYKLLHKEEKAEEAKAE